MAINAINGGFSEVSLNQKIQSQTEQDRLKNVQTQAEIEMLEKQRQNDELRQKTRMNTVIAMVIGYNTLGQPLYGEFEFQNIPTDNIKITANKLAILNSQLQQVFDKKVFAGNQMSHIVSLQVVDMSADQANNWFNDIIEAKFKVKKENKVIKIKKGLKISDQLIEQGFEVVEE